MNVAKLLPGLFCFTSVSLFSAEVSIPCSADASLWQHNPTHNTGGYDMVPAGTPVEFADQSRALFKFDLQGWIPQGAVIQSAQLKLNVVRSPDVNDPVTRIFNGHSMLVDWGEGDNFYLDPFKPMTSGVPAGPGECNWTHRFAGDDSKQWSLPGGELDVDYSEDISFQIFLTGVGEFTANLNIFGRFDLQRWLDDPSSNHGWMVMVDRNVQGTARQIATRENPVESLRPVLTVVYELPTPELTSFEVVNNEMRIEFPAAPETAYIPQYKDSLTNPVWQDLPQIGPIQTGETLAFTNDITGVLQRFYRVMQSP